MQGNLARVTFQNLWEPNGSTYIGKMTKCSQELSANNKQDIAVSATAAEDIITYLANDMMSAAADVIISAAVEVIVFR